MGWPSKQYLSYSEVIDKFMILIDNIDYVQRLAVPAMLSDMVKHMLHIPVRKDSNKVRRHQSADTVFRISQ